MQAGLKFATVATEKVLSGELQCAQCAGAGHLSLSLSLSLARSLARFA